MENPAVGYHALMKENKEQIKLNLQHFMSMNDSTRMVESHELI